MGRSLGAAAVAAIIGAAAWAALSIYGGREYGLLAWGIGGLVGFAMIKSGGHGTLLAVAAAVFAVLAIGTGKHFAYEGRVSQVISEVGKRCTIDTHAEVTSDAAAWHALGTTPTEDQVGDFAMDHDYDVDSADELRERYAPTLDWVHDNKPTLEKWRAYEQRKVEAMIAEEFSFFAYLKNDFNYLDILFIVLGLATAFGIVSRHTMELRSEARRRLRDERQSEESEAAPEPPPLNDRAEG